MNASSPIQTRYPSHRGQGLAKKKIKAQPPSSVDITCPSRALHRAAPPSLSYGVEPAVGRLLTPFTSASRDIFVDPQAPHAIPQAPPFDSTLTVLGESAVSGESTQQPNRRRNRLLCNRWYRREWFPFTFPSLFLNQTAPRCASQTTALIPHPRR